MGPQPARQAQVALGDPVRGAVRTQESRTPLQAGSERRELRFVGRRHRGNSSRLAAVQVTLIFPDGFPPHHFSWEPAPSRQAALRDLGR